MRKLEGGKDKAPLDWIRNTTSQESGARLELKQLMKRILSCTDDHLYYGLRCDGKDEKEVAPELRDSKAEDLSTSESAIKSHSARYV